jgi:hypothetical protein
MTPLKVYVGYDQRERDAFMVTVDSLLRHASAPVSITGLNIRQLNRQAVMLRPVRYDEGQMWDVISNAPQSTEFASSRFLTTILAQEGMALFVDGDTVFKRDVYQMVQEVYEGRSKAVYVVKHGYTPQAGLKMDQQYQTAYPRKNWSSVMLFDCDHPSNQRLTLNLINTLPGRDLHRFCWLRDYEIGSLGAEWNWLVGEQPKPEHLGIAHFTLGGPWLPNWQEHQHDEIWNQARIDWEVRPMRESPFLLTQTSYS